VKLKQLLNKEELTVTLLGLLLFSYLALRIVYTPLLHDEIATFFYYIQTGVFFPPDAHWDANNHILNSMLSNWSYQLFGADPWSLRLPNALFYVVFYLYSWKTTKYIKNPFIRWFTFLALVMAHYMFEYFGETRGYGMSMGLLMSGLYMLLSFFQDNKLWKAFVSITLLFLAVSANLTLVYIYLMVVALIVLFILLSKRKTISKLIIASIIVFISASFIAPLVWFSLELKHKGALYYGGKSSFIDYTLSTLSYLFLGSKNPVVIYGLIALSVALLVGFVYYLIYKKNEIKSIVYQPITVFVVLFFGSILAIFATRYILDVNFPEDRTAMYLYPSMVLSIGFVLNALTKVQETMSVSIASILLYMPIHFLVNTDVSKASFSMEERAPQEFFDYISESSRNMKLKPTVGGYVTQSLCWYYMNYKTGGEQNSILFSSFPDTVCDFQIINNTYALPKNFTNIYLKINRQSLNNLNLYQRKNPIKTEFIEEKNNITNWTHQSDEFFNLMELSTNSKMTSKAIRADIHVIIHAPHAPFEGILTISQKDANWNEISQERFVLNWAHPKLNDDTKYLQYSLILPHIDSRAEHIQIFLWNTRKKPFLLKNGSVKIYLLS
jgi:hypothetical protein